MWVLPLLLAAVVACAFLVPNKSLNTLTTVKNRRRANFFGLAVRCEFSFPLPETALHTRFSFNLVPHSNAPCVLQDILANVEERRCFVYSYLWSSFPLPLTVSLSLPSPPVTYFIHFDQLQKWRKCFVHSFGFAYGLRG